MKLRNTVIYIIGVPGVGKYTVAIRLGRMTGAKVVDNQLINTPIFSVLGYNGKDSFPFPYGAWEHIGKIHRAVLSVIRDLCPREDSFIFTNVLGSSEPGDLAWFKRVQRVARSRNAAFYPIYITCDAKTLRRRKNTTERKRRLKDIDLTSIPRWLEGFEVLTMEHPHALSLNTTDMTPQAAASRILKHIRRLSGLELARRELPPNGGA